MKQLIEFYDRTIIFIDEIQPDEVWVPITDNMVKGVKPYYSISNYGKVYSSFINRIMKQQQSRRGYMEIILHTETGETRVEVHRLVMLGFHYRDDHRELEVNHKYGDKTDNRDFQLEWMTSSENLKHSYDTGLHRKGEESVISTHTDKQVHLVCQALEKRMSLNEAVTYAGMEQNETNMKFVSAVKHGVVWKHISCKYNIPKERSKQMFTDDEIHEICKLFAKGMKAQDIIDELRLDVDRDKNWWTTMYNIRTKRRFTRISDEYF